MRLPLALTVPIPGLMNTLVAFEVLHLRVEDLPLSMAVGLAEIVAVGAETGLTVTLAVALTDLTELVAVSV